VRLATRGSPLARWQTDHVAALLRAASPGLEVEPVVVSTLGDRRQDQDIWQLGGAGVFVKEVQAAVLDGRADAAVHSAKDLPSNPALAAPGLVLAAVPERGDPRDALVGRSLADLPPGARVATGSTRRRAQLADLRPDLTFTGLRGAIATRLAKAADGEVAAVVVAAAALDRLGRLDEAAEVLAPEVVVPQIGQGALAVECRADDDEARRLLAAIEHPSTRRAVDAERGFLASLGGGCELPAAAHAVVADDGSARLTALLATLDGRLVLRTSTAVGPGDDPGETGLALGHDLLDRGGRWLLAS
jgi:hydroxymethylbilane synthase